MRNPRLSNRAAAFRPVEPVACCNAATVSYTQSWMGWGLGYVQVLGTGWAGANQTGVTRYTYTANGQLAGTTDTVDARKNQRFINDAQGRVLRKRANHIEGSASTPYTERHSVAAGQTWAISTSQVGEAARAAAAKQAGLLSTDAAQGISVHTFRPITGSSLTGGSASYTVREGDTLSGIAQGFYGDSRLWYLIAQANGLATSAVGSALTGPNTALVAGQILSIPANTAATLGSGNRADTFRPFESGAYYNDATPTLSTPPATQKGCGALGTLIVVAVAVAVTIATGNALLAKEVATGVAWAIAAAAGSVASQAVGIAIGMQEKFDWKQVGIAAIGGAVGGSIPGGSFSGNAIADAAMRTAVSNIATQHISVAVGLQERFNWRNVAASAISAGVGQALQNAQLGLSDAATVKDVSAALKGWTDNASAGVKMAVNLGQGLARGVTGALVRGGKIDSANIAADAFGNVLGQALGEAAVDTRRASSHLFRSSSLDLEPWASSDRFAVGGDFAVASAGAGARLSARGVYADAVDRDNWDHAAQGLAMPDRLPIRETVTAIAARGEGALALAQRLNPENPYAAMAQLAASGQLRFSSSANRWNLREGAIYTSDLGNYAPDTLSQMAGDARRWVSGEGRVVAARAQAALAARAVAAQSAPSMAGGTFFDAAEGLGPTLQEQLQQPRQMYASAQGLSKALVELQDGWQEFGVKLGAYAQRNDTWMGKAAHIAGAAVYISGEILPTSAGELAATVLLMGPGGRVVSAGLGRAVAGLEGLAARSGLTGLLDAAAQRTGMAYAQTARWVQDATRSGYAGAVDYLAPKVEHFLYRTGAVQYVVEPGAARFAQRVAVDGVEGVAANRGVPQAVELTFDKSTRTWTTPAGLDYGLGSEHGNRIKHVLAHTAPNPNKTMHSVFNVDRKQVLGLVDEAWIARSNPLPNDPGAYVVPMGRIVGTAGETNIKIIVRPGTTKIITAYPLQ